MGGIIKLVLNSMERIEARQETFLHNHMSRNTQAMEDLTSAIQNHAAKSELELFRLRTALKHAGLRPEESPDEG